MSQLLASHARTERRTPRARACSRAARRRSARFTRGTPGLVFSVAAQSLGRPRPRRSSRKHFWQCGAARAHSTRPRARSAPGCCGWRTGACSTSCDSTTPPDRDGGRGAAAAHRRRRAEARRVRLARRARALDPRRPGARFRPSSARRWGSAFMEDLTHEQVADALGVPLGTAKTRIRDGVQRLRSAFMPISAALVLVSAAGAGIVRWLAPGTPVQQSQRAVALLTSSTVTAIRVESVSGAETHAMYRVRARYQSRGAVDLARRAGRVRGAGAVRWTLGAARAR